VKKHEIDNEGISAGDVSLLYWGYACHNKTHTDRAHAHAHWQADFIVSGRVRMECNKVEHQLKVGDIFIIPPGIRHCYHYSDKAMSNWSVKFSIEALRGKFKPLIVVDNFENRSVGKLLTKLLSKTIGLKKLPASDFIYYTKDDSRPILIVHLLAAMMESNYFADRIQPEESRILKKMREFIHNNQGKKIKADLIAESVGYSKGHLCCLVKKETGVSLKAFIDAERFETAKSLLAYSELNISETADRMGFTDVFYFSNFFKRMSGESPSAFLKKIMAKPF